jgi:hypothetical protein
MKRVRVVLFAGAALCAFCALAWQSGFEVLGWTEADTAAYAQQFLVNAGPSQLPHFIAIKAAARKQLQAMGGPERVRVVQQLARYTRSCVSSPGFQKLHDQWIASNFKAVDHGIRLDAGVKKQDLEMTFVEAGMAMSAAQAAKACLRYDKAALKREFPADLSQWKRRAFDAKAKAIVARADEIAPLLDSNPVEFRKQYGLLKSIKLGGPDTWQGIEAAPVAGAKAQADANAKIEQFEYNQRTLKATLRPRLEAFVALARSVDFSAETRPVGNKRMFVNPAYERKDGTWKILYRLGKEPSLAAAAAAEAWLKEM